MSDRPRPTVGADDRLLGRVEVRPGADPGVRVLFVDGHRYGAVSLDDPTRLALGYLDRLRTLVEALLPAGPRRVLHLGGGAFALPLALAARRPELLQTVVERSATVIGLAQRELGLRTSPSMEVVHDDARRFLRDTVAGSWDAVIGDAFVGSETPRHLGTTEFAALVARALVRDGVYAVNLIDAPAWPVLAAHAATVRTALPHLLAVGEPGVADLRLRGNVFLVASHRQLDRPSLQPALEQADLPLQVVAGRRLRALADGARPRHDADG